MLEDTVKKLQSVYNFDLEEVIVARKLNIVSTLRYLNRTNDAERLYHEIIENYIDKKYTDIAIAIKEKIEIQTNYKDIPSISNVIIDCNLLITTFGEINTNKIEHIISQAYLNKGVALLVLQQFDKAESIFDIGINLYQNKKDCSDMIFPMKWNRLLALYKKGNYLKAKEDCDDLLKQLTSNNGNDYLRVLLIKAYVLHQLGRNKEAETAIRNYVRNYKKSRLWRLNAAIFRWQTHIDFFLSNYMEKPVRFTTYTYSIRRPLFENEIKNHWVLDYTLKYIGDTKDIRLIHLFNRTLLEKACISKQPENPIESIEICRTIERNLLNFKEPEFLEIIAYAKIEKAILLTELFYSGKEYYDIYVEAHLAFKNAMKIFEQLGGKHKQVKEYKRWMENKQSHSAIYWPFGKKPVLFHLPF